MSLKKLSFSQIDITALFQSRRFWRIFLCAVGRALSDLISIGTQAFMWLDKAVRKDRMPKLPGGSGEGGRTLDL